MTILHPGDEIHISIPIGELEGVEAAADSARVGDELRAAYGPRGVHIGIVSNCKGYGPPTIVAVFRASGSYVARSSAESAAFLGLRGRQLGPSME